MRYKIALLYSSGGSINFQHYTHHLHETDGKDVFIRGRMNALYKGLYTDSSSKIIIGNAPYKEFFMAVPESHPLFNSDMMDDINHHTNYSHTYDVNDCKVKYHREFKSIFLTLYKKMQDIKRHGKTQS